MGIPVAAILNVLRGVATAGALRGHYVQCDGDWAAIGVVKLEQRDARPSDLRRPEDAACWPRWLEIAREQSF